MSFSSKIVEWYGFYKRDLPWRVDQNPYRVWLSEVILQQTRVAQGMPYYEKFIHAYPELQDLAKAPLDEVLKLWQGLGYYSRARNMHETAQFIHRHYPGTFPNSYSQLISLKGVGDYTASAIASICYNEPCAVVDGNVYRVLSRYFGIDTPINSTAGIKEFKALAQECLLADKAGTYNQALMEFGSLQCTPANPNCEECPLNMGCVAFRTSKVSVLPVKISKTKVKKVHYHFVVFKAPNEKTIVEQRTGKGVWKGLYQFPLIESSGMIEEAEVVDFVGQKKQQGILLLDEELTLEQISLWNPEPWIHKLSHRHISAHFWVISLEKPLKNGVAWKELDTFAVPVLIAKFFDAFKI